MKLEEIKNHIQNAVIDSFPEDSRDKEQQEKEIVNQLYSELGDSPSYQALHKMRKQIKSGKFFGKKFKIDMILLDKCGLEVVEKS